MIRQKLKPLVILFFSLFLGSQFISQLALSRAGGGRSSSGSRGSRGSFSAPSRSAPAPRPAQPADNAFRRQEPAPVAPAPQMARPSFFRSMAGGLAGGFLGSMLFNSLGFGGGMGGHGGGGGLGIFELLLFGGLIYFGYRYLKRKQQENDAATGGTSFYTAPETNLNKSSSYDSYAPISTVSNVLPASTIKTDDAMDIFFKVQTAWMKQDLAKVDQFLVADIKRDFQSKIDDLKKEGRVNKLESIAVRDSIIEESWTENDGTEFATLHITANLLDYTVDSSGKVVEGSDSDSVKFEEFWTFARSPNASIWKLSAIDQVSPN